MVSFSNKIERPDKPHVHPLGHTGRITKRKYKTKGLRNGERTTSSV
jgi:hypothetical protein